MIARTLITCVVFTGLTGNLCFAEQKVHTQSKVSPETMVAVVWNDSLVPITTKQGLSTKSEARFVSSILKQGYSVDLIHCDLDLAVLASYDVVILLGGWADHRSAKKRFSLLIESKGEEFKSYLRQGGILWALQPSPYLQRNERYSPTWFPYPISFDNNSAPFKQRVQIAMPKHPLFRGITAEEAIRLLPKPADTPFAYSDDWRVLALHGVIPCLMEASYGKGHCLVIPSHHHFLPNYEALIQRVMTYLSERQSGRVLPQALSSIPLTELAGIDQVTAKAAIKMMDSESLKVRRRGEAIVLQHRQTMLVELLDEIQKNVATHNLKSSYQDLVNQLGSRSFQEREAADKLLTKAGFPALKVLARGASSDNLEIAHRCRRLLEKLNHTNDIRLTSQEIQNRMKPGQLISYVRVMYHIGTPDAITGLEILSRSTSPAAARLAAFALRDLKTPVQPHNKR